jgi:hypothetical protein
MRHNIPQLFIPSFPSALQLRVSFGLLNNPPPFFSILHHNNIKKKWMDTTVDAM